MSDSATVTGRRMSGCGWISYRRQTRWWFLSVICMTQSTVGQVFQSVDCRDLLIHPQSLDPLLLTVNEFDIWKFQFSIPNLVSNCFHKNANVMDLEWIHRLQISFRKMYSDWWNKLNFAIESRAVKRVIVEILRTESAITCWPEQTETALLFGS